MTINRYGKSSSSLLNLKTSFFEDNYHFMDTQKQLALLYKVQPKRINCKNCDSKLGSVCDFVKDGIEYIFCDRCKHLNGLHEDTNTFNEKVYTGNSGEQYAQNYSENDVESYNYRLTSIYLPKAEFLYTSLLNDGINPHTLEFFDFGAGSGYFAGALKKIGLKNVSGTEVSKIQVQFANAMLGDNLLSVHELDNTIEILRETKFQVVSMIGVLEHLQHPREVLQQLQNNKNIKYIYISVPLFSLSVYLEILSPNVFHRQLHGGHTHLYTEDSLSHMCEEFGFKSIAEWWFGTDVVDLYRNIFVTLEQTKSSTKLMDKLQQDFIPIIDAMQLEIDKKHLSSEVHMLLKKI